MPSFEIPDGPTTIALTNQVVKGQNVRAGTATFSITNKMPQRLAARLSVPPQGNTKAEWFEIQGEKERIFAASETQKIAVNLKAPANTPAGDYKFRFRVVNVNDPDNDYTESGVVTFNIAAAQPDKHGKRPWWLWAAAAAVVLLLIVGGVVAALVFSSGTQVAVPDVVGKTYAEAEKAITDKKLVAERTEDTTPGKTPGTVVSENPPKDTQVDEGSKVTLAVAKGVNVPDARNKSFDAARQQLVDAGFTVAPTPVRGTPSGAPPNTVIAQNPAPGSEAGAGGNVVLTIDPGVAVPNMVGVRQENIGDRLKDFSVSINVRHEVGDVGVIVATNPPADQVVAKNAPLQVTVRGAPCIGRGCIQIFPYEVFKGRAGAILSGKQ